MYKIRIEAPHQARLHLIHHHCYVVYATTHWRRYRDETETRRDKTCDAADTRNLKLNAFQMFRLVRFCCFAVVVAGITAFSPSIRSVLTYFRMKYRKQKYSSSSSFVVVETLDGQTVGA